MLSAPLSLGELIDRLTILEIKTQRIAAPGKRAAAQRELLALRAAATPYLSENVRRLQRQLARVNRMLWDLENASRQRFRRAPAPHIAPVLLTRIASGNDLRHRLKQRISRLDPGGVVEQKSYL